MDNSYADAKHLVSSELFTDKINACITALGGTPGAAPGAGNNYADKQHLISREIFNAKMNELAAAISSGGTGWKTFTWTKTNTYLSFGDNGTRDHYLNTPEPFYVLIDGSELCLAVITSGTYFTYTNATGDTFTMEVFAVGVPDGVVSLQMPSGTRWSDGALRTLPIPNGASEGAVLRLDADLFPRWSTGISFPTVTITQEDLGAQILTIGAFAAQANDTVKMKTFSFTGTAGSSIAGKILTILENSVGFIEIQGFGVQAIAYKMGQRAVSTTQTYGYFDDPTKPFLFSADYVIQDVATGSVDLNFYVQKVNVAS